MSVQYTRALAEKLTIEGVIRELSFKRSHLLTQATNTKMELDSYERRLAEVKLNVERYKPANPDSKEYPPHPWPVMKTEVDSKDRPKSASKYTSEHTEIEAVPLQSPPRIEQRKKLLSYREFMRKYHDWSPGTEMEKVDDIEEFSDDETKLYSVVKTQLQKMDKSSPIKVETLPMIPAGKLPQGTRPLDLVTLGHEGVAKLVAQARKEEEDEKKPIPSPLVRRSTGGKGLFPLGYSKVHVVEDSEDEKPSVSLTAKVEVDYDSDKTDTIFPEEGGWIAVASETYKDGDYQPPAIRRLKGEPLKDSTPKRAREEPLEAPGAPKKTKGDRWICGNFCDDCKKNFYCAYNRDFLPDFKNMHNSPK